MMIGLAIALVLAGLYVGANIGANDAANCVGACVGAGLVRYRTAVLILALFVVAGALLQGGGVSHTIGKGIVTEPIAPAGVLAALLCGGLFVTLATLYKVPVSTSQAIVGAVAGVGVAAQLTVNWSKSLSIVGSWVLCPILSLGLTYGIYWLTLRILRRGGDDQRTARKVIRWLVLGSAAYTSYTLGANHLGVAIGPIRSVNAEVLDLRILTILGALSIAGGAMLFGRGVMDTVGKSIVPLDLPSAFAVQVSAGFGLHLFSILGVPVSSSQAIVGSLMGIGLYQGAKNVSRRKVTEVVIGWVATPTLAAVVSFLIYRLILLLQSWH